MAALKTAGVPVIWVGLPPQRNTKASSDSAYLNEIYRSRAEKAGITYVDVWDGFVDESGRFAQQGPDYEGQTRRLRSGDGVFFTKFGARKLAHYVEREIQRHITNRAVPVALPIPVEPGTPGAAKPGGPAQRPAVGPVIPLTASAAPPVGGADGRRARAAAGDARSGREPRAHQGRADHRSDRPRRRFQPGRAEAHRSPSRSRCSRPRRRRPRRRHQERQPKAGQPGAATAAARHDRRSGRGRSEAGAAEADPLRPTRRDRRSRSSRASSADVSSLEGASSPPASSAAAWSIPSGTCRPRGRTGGLRGSPTPPATGRGACRRPRTPSGSSCDRPACRP